MCHEVTAELMAYLNHDLPADQQEVIRDHLALCDACALALRETKALEAELMTETTWRRPILSPEASLRIQEQVYRRMRRSLFIQRTRGLMQMAGAVIVAAALFAGMLLLGSQWLQYLSTPESIPGDNVVLPNQTADEFTTSPHRIRPGEDGVEREPTRLALPSTPISPQRSNIPTSDLAPPTSITPGQQPAKIAAMVMESALDGDSERLKTLFGAMRSSQIPTLRVWRRITSRCEGMIAPSELRYEALPGLARLITRVDMYQGSRYIGELKMRRIDGEWFTVFASYPSLSCQQKAE